MSGLDQENTKGGGRILTGMGLNSVLGGLVTLELVAEADTNMTESSSLS